MMRTLMKTVLIATGLAGAAIAVTPASAQPYGYYPHDDHGGWYDRDYGYRHDGDWHRHDWRAYRHYDRYYGYRGGYGYNGYYGRHW